MACSPLVFFNKVRQCDISVYNIYFRDGLVRDIPVLCDCNSFCLHFYTSVILGISGKVVGHLVILIEMGVYLVT